MISQLRILFCVWQSLKDNVELLCNAGEMFYNAGDYNNAKSFFQRVYFCIFSIWCQGKMSSLFSINGIINYYNVWYFTFLQAHSLDPCALQGMDIFAFLLSQGGPGNSEGLEKYAIVNIMHHETKW